MKTRLAAVFIIVVSAGGPAVAHRLDEYLQATTISVEKDRVRAELRLTPGVAVFPIVCYAERVLRDLSLAVDGERLRLRLASVKFPGVDGMKEGLGEIQIEFEAILPRGGGERRLVFENHHQRPIAAYLVNCLVPRDPDIRITAQKRNYEQSFYQLEYQQAGIRAGPLSAAWWSGAPGLFCAAAGLLFARLAFERRQRARAA